MSLTSVVQNRSAIRYPGYVSLLAIWSVIGALTYGRNYLQYASSPESKVVPNILSCIACYLPWVALSPLVFRLERKYPLGPSAWLRNLSRLALASLPVSLAASPLMAAFNIVVRYAVHAPVHPPSSYWYWLREFPVAEALFWCSAAAGYIIRSLMQQQEQEREAARLALEKSQLESSLREAQLEALRARLNPHFLFNSLQNISVLVQQDPRTASRMLTLLGDLLRAVLRRDSQVETPLKAEVALTQTYVAMEKMRFGDRLSVVFDLEPDASAALVPCFLLQPLVENAIVHGLKGVDREGRIAIRAARAGKELVVTVTDNGAGPPTEELSEMKVGVGLGSTFERLSRMYPGSHRLSMRKLPEGGAEVRIEMPFRLARATNGKVPHEQTASVGR